MSTTYESGEAFEPADGAGPDEAPGYDTTEGRVFPDGTISKTVTPADRARLDRGGALARRILHLAGATEDTIVTLGKIYGGHLGATAAIGEVVDTRLQTDVDGLFVCDGSVLPLAPGLPPVLTIMALAKRLGRTLAPDGRSGHAAKKLGSSSTKERG
jgi:choline dehydrogenase-like flavoprotein